MVGYYFRHVSFDAFPVFVTTGFELSLHIHQATFLQVITGQIGQTAPQYYRVPVGVGARLSVFVFVAFGGGERKFGDGYVAIELLEIWPERRSDLTEVSDEGYFVYSTDSKWCDR